MAIHGDRAKAISRLDLVEEAEEIYSWAEHFMGSLAGDEAVERLDDTGKYDEVLNALRGQYEQVCDRVREMEAENDNYEDLDEDEEYNRLASWLDGISQNMLNLSTARLDDMEAVASDFPDVLPPEADPSYDGHIDRTRPVQKLGGEAETYGDPDGGFLSQLMSIGNVYTGPSELKVRLERDIDEDDGGLAETDMEVAQRILDRFDVDASLAAAAGESAAESAHTYEDAVEELKKAYDEADALRLRLLKNDTDGATPTQVDIKDIQLGELGDEFYQGHVDIYPEPLGGDTSDAHGSLESSPPTRAVLEINDLAALLEDEEFRIDSGGRYEIQAEMLRAETEGDGRYRLMENGVGRHHVTEENVTGNPWTTEEGESVWDLMGIGGNIPEGPKDFLYGPFGLFGRPRDPEDPKAPDPKEDDDEDYSLWKDALTSTAVHGALSAMGHTRE